MNLDPTTRAVLERISELEYAVAGAAVRTESRGSHGGEYKEVWLRTPRGRSAGNWAVYQSWESWFLGTREALCYRHIQPQYAWAGCRVLERHSLMEQRRQAE